MTHGVSAAERRRRWAGRLGRLAVVVAVIAITVFLFSVRDEVVTFARFGYPGIFIFTLLTYATVILPAPGATVIVIMGAVFNPFWVGVVAGAGAALGELTGYAAGYSGRAVIENVRVYRRIRDWMQHSPGKTFWGLILLSALPNPAFDVAGIAAGVLRVPLARFLGALLIGETIKMWLFAYGGAYSIEWVVRLIR